MSDFLAECSARSNRPGIMNTLMVATTAKFYQYIDDMYEFAEQSESMFLLRDAVYHSEFHMLSSVFCSSERQEGEPD